MFSKLVAYPAEFASSFGLWLMALATPFLVVGDLPGALRVAGTVPYAWAYTAVAGFAACAALVQCGALWQAGVWPRARLWSCRLAMVASLLFLFAFAPVRFYGSVVAATILLVINWFSTVSWESRRSASGKRDA